jgi:hypothetical protein
MNINFKELLSVIAIIITFVAFIPYVRSIYIGKTKPHVFSWVIWGLATFIVFLAQLADDGGAGTWAIGISGIISLLIAIFAYYKRADISITKSDWIFFVLALSAIPFWYITSNPLWAVIILTSVDTVGYLPTIRKSYLKPFEEQLLLYILIAIRNIIAAIALEHYSVTTLLFPVTISLTCIIFTAIVVYRRKTSKEL